MSEPSCAKIEDQVIYYIRSGEQLTEVANFSQTNSDNTGGTDGNDPEMHGMKGSMGDQHSLKNLRAYRSHAVSEKGSKDQFDKRSLKNSVELHRAKLKHGENSDFSSSDDT